MKFVKKILGVILTFLLTNLIIILVVSLNLKTIIVDGVIKEIVISNITNNNYKEANYIIDEEILSQVTNDEKVKEILSSDEVQNLLNKYLDITVDNLTDEDNIDEVELEKDIYNYLKDNKEELSKIVGSEVTDEMIDNATKQLEDKDMSRAFKQTLINAHNSMTKKEKKALEIYKLAISTKFKIIISVLIILNILLIALVKKSLQKVISNVGYATMIAGLTIIIMSIATNIIVRNISKIIKFNTNNLLVSGIILFIFGLLAIIVDKIIDNIKSKRESL